MPAEEISQVCHVRLPLWDHIPTSTPWVIYVQPSGFCNLKCQFCPHGREPQKLIKDLMTYDVFKKLIDDLSVFPEIVKLLRVCGNGEPLLNRDIVRMLEYAQAARVTDKIEVITNGLLLNDELTTRLPKVVDRMIVSVEGLTEADYREVSSAKIDLPAFLRSLDSLYAHRGNCTIHIKIHHKAVSSEARRAAFYEMFDSRCDQTSIENLVPMWPEVTSSYFARDFRWGDGGVIKRRVCAQIFKGVQVQANGEVVPCCVDWKRVNLLGDISHESLSEIWLGEKLRKLQLAHLAGEKSSLEPCKACTMNDYCEFDNIDSHAEECMDRLCGQGSPPTDNRVSCVP